MHLFKEKKLTKPKSTKDIYRTLMDSSPSLSPSGSQLDIFSKRPQVSELDESTESFLKDFKIVNFYGTFPEDIEKSSEIPIWKQYIDDNALGLFSDWIKKEKWDDTLKYTGKSVLELFLDSLKKCKSPAAALMTWKANPEMIVEILKNLSEKYNDKWKVMHTLSDFITDNDHLPRAIKDGINKIIDSLIIDDRSHEESESPPIVFSLELM
ncbi:MAG: hypothetical protein QM752_01860 [Gammaproteobacteria bacterium]